MNTWDYNMYLGNEADDIHISFASNDNFFIVAEVRNAIKKEELDEILNQIKTTIVEEKVSDLASFETVLDDALSEITDKSKFAIAAALVIENVIYLVTRGSGEIHVARDSALQKLISGENSSSGYLHEKDLFILANENFFEHVSQTRLGELVASHTPQDIVETLTPDLKGKDDVGLIALFAQYKRNIETDEDVGEEEVSVEQVGEERVYEPLVVQEPQRKPNFLSKLQQTTSKDKKVTTIILGILIVIFIWSVAMGSQRRAKANFIEKIQTQQEVIDSKLLEADELALLNTPKALQLIKESRLIHDELLTEADEKNLKNLEELVTLGEKINAAEQELKKVEEGTFSEYYDLNLIEKGASAQSLYSDGETLAMLDTANGKVYLLSIEKKSVVTLTSEKAEDAEFVALHRGVPYILGKSIGVVRLDDDGEEELIRPDEDWGSLQDFWMYNGNIYVLDAGNDEVYKYLVAENGYSNKSSYFAAGQSQDLANATAMAIDSSVYVAIGSQASKYIAGSKDSFSVSLPDETNVDFEDIYTDGDIDAVYLLDKDSRRIFIVTKDGSYDKQVSASIIGSADDFVVDQNLGILVLVKDTIYTIEAQ